MENEKQKFGFWATVEKIKGQINRQQLLWSFVFTYAIGLIAHAYAFLNLLASHDSLKEFAYNKDYWIWKIQLGRYLKPLYDFVLGKFGSFPWTNGLIALLWLSLSVYFVVRIFGFEKKSHIAIIAGIMSTNIVVSSLAATYIPDLSSNMLSLLFAVFACFLWLKMTENIKSLKKSHIVLMSLCTSFLLFLSMGIYQAFLFVFIAIVLIVSIQRLMTNPEKVKTVWLNDIIAAVDTLIGGGMYCLGLKLSTFITGIEQVDGYNSVKNAWTNTESFAYRIGETLYEFIFYTLADSEYVYPTIITFAINVALALLCIISIFSAFRHKKDSENRKSAFVSTVLFVCALPFVMCGTRLLNSVVHQIMIYACFFTYVLYLCIAETGYRITQKNVLKRITCVLLCCFIFINIQTANAGYVKKSTEQQSTLSVMTRVIDKIETTDGYRAGETPVAFIGVPGNYTQEYEEFSNFSKSTGLLYHNAITFYGYYEPYFDIILKADINIADSETADKITLTDRAKAMPVFPAEGSVKVIDGTVVVKFTTPYTDIPRCIENITTDE